MLCSSVKFGHRTVANSSGIKSSGTAQCKQLSNQVFDTLSAYTCSTPHKKRESKESSELTY